MQPESIQKYENYKEQFKRLNKAIDNKFYLEALFISYAIIEDRSEAILSYEENEINSKNFVSINKKLNKIKELADDGYNLANDLYNEVHRLRRLLKTGKLESFCDDYCKRKGSFLKENEEAGK